MRCRLAGAVACLFLLTLALARPQMSKSELQKRISDVLNQPEVAASSWSIEAAVWNRRAPASSVDEIFSYNPLKLHRPASNTKGNLLTIIFNRNYFLLTFQEGSIFIVPVFIYFPFLILL